MIEHSNGYLFIDHVIPYLSVRYLLDTVFFTSKQVAALIQRQRHYTIIIDLFNVRDVSTNSMLAFARGLLMRNYSTYSRECVKNLLEINHTLDEHWVIIKTDNWNKLVMHDLSAVIPRVRVLVLKDHTYGSVLDFSFLHPIQIDTFRLASKYLKESVFNMIRCCKVKHVELYPVIYIGVKSIVKFFGKVKRIPNVSARLADQSSIALKYSELGLIDEYPKFSQVTIRYHRAKLTSERYSFSSYGLEILDFNGKLPLPAVTDCHSLTLSRHCDSISSDGLLFNILHDASKLTRLEIWNGSKIQIAGGIIHLPKLISLELADTIFVVGEKEDANMFVELLDVPLLKRIVLNSLNMNRLPLMLPTN